MRDRFVLTRGRLILIILLLVIIIGIVIGINAVKNNNKSKYKEFEEQLEAAGETYYINNNLSVKQGEERRVTLSELKKQDLVGNDLKDKCDGYILIKNEKDYVTNEYDLVYEANIKCGKKYTTSTYTEY